MDNAGFALSYLAYFTQHNVFKVHPYHGVGQNHLPFQGWIILHCTGTLLTRSSIDGHLGCFHILAITNNAAVSTGVQISLETLLSVILGIQPEAGLLGDTVNLFLRSRHPAFHSCCAILHSHPQCARVAANTFYCFFDSSHPNGCEVLVCISSMIDDIEHLFMSYGPLA